MKRDPTFSQKYLSDTLVVNIGLRHGPSLAIGNSIEIR